MMVPVNGEKKHIVMYHYPILEWNKSFRGAYHLFGHVHTGQNQHYEDNNQQGLDIGVDNHDFQPLTISDIDKIMKGRNWVSPFEQQAKSNDLPLEDGKVVDRSMTENYGS